MEGRGGGILWPLHFFVQLIITEKPSSPMMDGDRVVRWIEACAWLTRYQGKPLLNAHIHNALLLAIHANIRIKIITPYAEPRCDFHP